MGVPETEPVPASLAFLADETTMEKSFDKYLAGTDLYRAKLKQWEEDKKLKPDAKQPEPSEVANDAVGNLVEFDLFGQARSSGRPVVAAVGSRSQQWPVG